MAGDKRKGRRPGKKLLYKHLLWLRAVKLPKGREDREQSCLIRACRKDTTAVKTSLPTLSQELLFRTLPSCPSGALSPMLRLLAEMLYSEATMPFLLSDGLSRSQDLQSLPHRVLTARSLVSLSNTICAHSKHTDPTPCTLTLWAPLPSPLSPAPC